MFNGALTAIVTPFFATASRPAGAARAGRIPIQGGVDGLVPCGSTGESGDAHSFRARAGDKTRYPAGAPARSGSGGTGSNSTAEAIRFTASAARGRRRRRTLISPYYNKPTRMASSGTTK